MANAKTEHSRQLRQKTADQYQREKLASGEIAQITIRADAQTIENFKAMLAEIGGTRPEALRKLYALYQQQK